VFVLTADQRDSRGSADRVGTGLRALAEAVPSPARGFERTAGDEVQGVLDGPGDVLRAVLALVRDGRWSVGVGVGPVERPLPASTRAGRGPAFTAAREAVEQAKLRPHHVALVGTDAAAAVVADADAVLALALSVSARWSEEAVEAVDLVESGLTQTAAAERLGVTRQAVGQRLQAALWRQHADALEVVRHLLGRAEAAVREGPS
jgi:predicted DCC family thiol-disulfide oxidoreductase YuxK